MTDWETDISDAGKDACVRGVPLEDVMELDFADAIWLLHNEAAPTEAESTVFTAVLSGCIDHGVGNPSSVAARTIQSGGNGLNASVAGGVLALGDLHGGAIEDAMYLLQEGGSPEEIVERRLDRGERIPGLGHRVYEEEDPRSAKLFSIADREGVAGTYVEKYRRIQEAFADRKTSLVINVDGAIAAIMSDLGWEWQLGKGIFIMARTPGLVAHVREEMDEEPFRRADGAYTGPPPE